MKTHTSSLITGACAAALFVLLGASVTAQDSPSPKTDSAAASSAIAKTESEWEGISVELLSVKRGDGDTITIQFKYVNNGSKEFSPTSTQLGGNSASEEVYYVDPKNKKKYTVIEDAQKKAIASNMRNISLEPGASRSGWTKLPAPPADVTKITVYIPGAPPFESVPLAP
jgi:hypothetical protein